MTGRFLVDTNILVYAYDRSEPEKQKRAIRILEGLAENNAGVLSVQILSEFFIVVTKKIPYRLTLKEASRSIGNYVRSWEVVEINSFIVLEAIRGVEMHKFSFWDSLVWATAKMNQIPVILSEDFAHNSVVETVQFLNPFKEVLKIEKK